MLALQECPEERKLISQKATYVHVSYVNSLDVHQVFCCTVQPECSHVGQLKSEFGDLE